MSVNKDRWTMEWLSTSEWVENWKKTHPEAQIFSNLRIDCCHNCWQYKSKSLQILKDCNKMESCNLHLFLYRPILWQIISPRNFLHFRTCCEMLRIPFAPWLRLDLLVTAVLQLAGFSQLFNWSCYHSPVGK